MSQTPSTDRVLYADEPVQLTNPHASEALDILGEIGRERKPPLSSREAQANAQIAYTHATLALAQEVKNLRVMLEEVLDG